MNELKIATFNANGLRERSKRFSVFEHFRHRQYDIVAIQEAHSKQEDEESWSQEYERAGFTLYNHSSALGAISILLSKFKPTFIEYGNILHIRVQKLK